MHTLEPLFQQIQQGFDHVVVEKTQQDWHFVGTYQDYTWRVRRSHEAGSAFWLSVRHQDHVLVRGALTRYHYQEHITKEDIEKLCLWYLDLMLSPQAQERTKIFQAFLIYKLLKAGLRGSVDLSLEEHSFTARQDGHVYRFACKNIYRVFEYTGYLQKRNGLISWYYLADPDRLTLHLPSSHHEVLDYMRENADEPKRFHQLRKAIDDSLI